MNNLVSRAANGQTVTTSLDIAEGVERSHRSIIQLVREHITDLEAFGRVQFEIAPFETAGGVQNRDVALLNEHHATLLLTFMRNIGIVKDFKIRLVRAFFEMRDALETRPAPAVADLSRMDILQLAMQSEQERIQLEQERRELNARIEQQAPRVAFAQQVELAPDAISVARAAKLLGTGQRRLFAFLRKIGWVTRHNEPYQRRIESGDLDVKLARWEHPNHGLQQSVTALVTGKGLARLEQLWRERHAESAA